MPTMIDVTPSYKEKFKELYRDLKKMASNIIHLFWLGHIPSKKGSS